MTRNHRFNNPFSQPGTKRSGSFQRRLRLESLEGRTLLSVTVLETEYNGTFASADLVPLERDGAGRADATLKGSIATPGDRDFYEMTLKAGDVIGAAVQGQGKLDPVVRLHGPDETLLAWNDNHEFTSALLPQESPLPAINSNDPEALVYYVVSSPGSYFLEIGGSGEASVGTYRTDVVVARPGMEAEPVGTRQLLYVDFGGATLNTTIFGGSGMKTLSPLSDFLEAWELTAADENAVVDRAIKVMEKTLSQHIRTTGLNGDYAKSGVPGEFDIEILNSRDHPDFDGQFGSHPYLSRVVVGGTRAQVDPSSRFYARAQHLDPGNFSFDDDAVVVLDGLSRPAIVQADPNRASLNWIEIADGSTKADLVGTALGILAAHEAGHNFGALHTEELNEGHNVMDIGGPGDLLASLLGLGPDGKFGSGDDYDVRFGVDNYGDPRFQPPGGTPTRNDSLNTIAFGLSTGTRDAEFDAAALWFSQLEDGDRRENRKKAEPLSAGLIDSALLEFV